MRWTAILCVAAFGGIAAQAATPATVQGSWAKVACPFDSTKALLPVTCGRLTVPENYDYPGRSIEIAVMIVNPANNIDPEHPVIFLNGGPGGTSLVFAERLVTTPAIRDTVVDRDWVFFDQRGAGRSTPALYCPQGKDWFDDVKTCRDQLIKQGVDLSQYNSARSAGDIEALRKALGVKQWNLWGASYGSRLAFTMARDYPSSVHSIIHDGPDLPEDQEVVDDLRGTEVVLHKLFSKCAADTACAAKFPQLRSRFLAAIPRLRQQPLSIGDERFNDNRVLGFVHDWLFSHLRVPLEHRVQNLLTYMDAAARGDGALLLEIQQSLAKEEAAQRTKAKEEDAKVGTPYPDPFPVEGKYQMGQGLSIDCYEEKAFESMDEYAQAMAKSEVVRALLGADGGVGNFKTCALWPSGRANALENAHVDYDGPQLAFTGELDASLSGLAGYQIAMLYANATNVVFKNAGHIQVHMDDAYPSRDYNYYRPCASGLARQFLADPQQPLDTRCAETQKLRLVH